MWYLWSVPVVIVVFLWKLNAHLRGRLKNKTAAVLFWTIIGLIVAAFAFSGWKAGTACLVVLFVTLLVATPIARGVARRLSGYSDPRIERYNQNRMGELLAAAEEGNFLEAAEQHQSADREHMKQAIAGALAQPSIKKTLTDRGCDQRDLAAFYRRVEVMALPPQLREVALQNPGVVGFFLDNSTPSTTQSDYLRNVASLDVAMVLGLWLADDPASLTPPSE